MSTLDVGRYAARIDPEALFKGKWIGAIIRIFGGENLNALGQASLR